MPEKIPDNPSNSKAESGKSKERIKKSLEFFNSLLDSSPDLTLTTRGFIEAKIEMLQEELGDNTLQDKERAIEEAVEAFQNAMAKEAAVVTLQNEIKAFYKKELYADALESLKELIKQHEADNFCVIAVMGCMLRLHPKKELAAAVDRFIADAFQDDQSGVHFKRMMAKKMAKKGYAEHAAMLLS